ncbi:MAG: N-acetyl-alpha-D-glucosaminyl L-malate synthase [Acinetobacter bereziniae]|uniref:N-acetyl-alpha-D-glucosaminyl L-malate synthase n=1 Tax=Acinetobacter bereziniae TaxID=106648 RepID=A0A833UPU8_ACIBZ|nr:MAG: N-acetyl-alpha-D-glucosaminyl L-malate synthase [Acinetobacter bereziniae]
MNILYLITGLGGGGAEKVVTDLANQMSLRGHNVKIAYLKGEVVVRPENKSIELICLGLESLIDTKIAYLHYKKIILEFSPDVVHAHMVHANIFARIARKFYSVPKLICTAHNSNEGGKLRMLFYRYTNYLSDLNTNVSKEATEKFIKLKAFTQSAITIYNGIDLNKFNRNNNLSKSDFIKNDEKLLLAVGRFNLQKDYPNLLTAIRKLKKANQLKFKLIIAGDGELKTLIERSIVELDLVEDVILLGRREDIPDLMSIADVFVLSSAWEGFGLVVAEAMACETFVVATDCGGVKEVMGGFGQLVPIKNSDILAEKLQYALNLSAREQLTNNKSALKYVQNNFDLQQIIDQWLNIYASK